MSVKHELAIIINTSDYVDERCDAASGRIVRAIWGVLRASKGVHCLLLGPYALQNHPRAWP